jgi:ADP-ribose pyrophosphatase YjhB (NUDIX family)
LHHKVESLIKAKYKTRSEFFREIINLYFRTVKTASEPLGLEESDLAKVLKCYWHFKSQTDLKIIIIALGIIVNNQGKVLIGARKQRDPWVENLSWVFPGGQIESLDFEKELKKDVKKETGLKIKVNSLVASRIHPDSGFKPVQIVALYFYCEPVSNSQKVIPGGDLSKLLWVKPTKVFKYFTTSVCDDVTKFLTAFER